MYLVPIDVIEYFVLGRMEESKKTMYEILDSSMYPTRMYMYYAGKNTFTSAISLAPHNINVLAGLSIFHRSATEVYSPELFGYNLYDSPTLRFRETPLPPTYFCSMVAEA